MDGVVAEQAAEAETSCAAPWGEEVLAKDGELSPQGVAGGHRGGPEDQWVVLNVREDQLQRFALKSRFTAGCRRWAGAARV